MIRFAFWNTNRRTELSSQISELAHEFRIDVLILAECSIPAGRLLEQLNAKQSTYYLASIGTESVTVFTRFSNDYLKRLRDERRYTFWCMRLPGLDEVLLVTAHLPSKRYRTDHYGIGASFSQAIIEVEQGRNHDRTIVIGDLNMNPFELGVFAANALNGVMTRDEANRQVIVVNQRKCPLFYNPMWSHFGDGTPGPPGTYYYRGASGYEQVRWNMFDQVLLRPSLLPHFQNETLKILSWNGTIWSDTERGRPTLSDHHPILFALSI